MMAKKDCQVTQLVHEKYLYKFLEESSCEATDAYILEGILVEGLYAMERKRPRKAVLTTKGSVKFLLPASLGQATPTYLSSSRMASTMSLT